MTVALDAFRSSVGVALASLDWEAGAVSFCVDIYARQRRGDREGAPIRR